MSDSAVAPPHDEGLDDFRPPRSILPLLIVAALLIGGGVAGFMLFNAQNFVPNRIVVAVETVGLEGETGRWWAARGKNSARYVDLLSKELNRLGIETVKVGDKKLDPLIEEGLGSAADVVERVAPAMEAAWVLSGGVVVKAVRQLPEVDKSEYELHVSLKLHAVQRKETVTIVEGDRFFTIDSDEGQAIKESLENMVQRHLTRIGTALAAQPELVRLGGDDTSQFTRDEIRIAGDLGRLFFVERQRKALLDKRAGEEAEGAAKEKERRLSAKQRLGPYLAEEYVVGPAGKDRVLLMTEDQAVEVYPDANDYAVREGRDQLVLASPDGKNRTVLLDTYNIFSFPDVSRDGSTVAVVLDHYGWSKSLVAIAIDAKGEGKQTQLLAHESHYYSSPRVSPDGSKVAFWFRKCRRCDSSLEVIGSDGNGRKRLLEAGGDYKGIPHWGPDSKRVFLSLLPPGGARSIHEVDVTTGKNKPLLGTAVPPPEPTEAAAAPDKGTDKPAGEGEEVPPADDHNASDFDFPAVSPDGKWLAVVEVDPSRGRHVGLYDLTKGSYKRVTGGRAARLEFSPDSSMVAAETKGTKSADDPNPYDWEIAVVAIATQKAWVVTFNSHRDRLGGWSPDSKWIYTTDGSRDPDGKNWANRVYWSPVAPPK